jgi:hypothetical protein
LVRAERKSQARTAQTGGKENKCVNLRSEHRSTGIEEQEINESFYGEEKSERQTRDQQTEAKPTTDQI